MFPLLDLYICIDDKIDIDKYKTILLDFEKLWGMHAHILTENINNYKKIDNFIDMIGNIEGITYSLGDGILNNKFNNINIEICKKFKTKNFTAIEIIINKKLIQDDRYKELIEDIMQNNINLEVYFKVNKDNINDLKHIIDFCNSKSIKLCIVDIDKTFNKSKITGEEYRKVLDFIKDVNNEKKVRISIAECPYLNIEEESLKTILGGCSGGITSCMIDTKGNVILCYYLKDVIVDNINNRNLINIWNESVLLNKIRDRDNIEGKCAKCENLLCCGGCRAESYFKYNDLFNEDINCWM